MTASPGDAERHSVLVPRELLEALVDPDPCWFDHHGGCQAHGWLEPDPGAVCPQERLKALLEKVLRA